MNNLIIYRIILILCCAILNADLKQDLDKSGYPAHYTNYSVFELIDQNNQN